MNVNRFNLATVLARAGIDASKLDASKLDAIGAELAASIAGDVSPIARKPRGAGKLSDVPKPRRETRELLSRVRELLTVSVRLFDLADQADNRNMPWEEALAFAEADAGGGTTAAGSFAPDADGFRGTRTFRLRYAEALGVKYGEEVRTLVRAETEAAFDLAKRNEDANARKPKGIGQKPETARRDAIAAAAVAALARKA